VQQFIAAPIKLGSTCADRGHTIVPRHSCKALIMLIDDDERLHASSDERHKPIDSLALKEPLSGWQVDQALFLACDRMWSGDVLSRGFDKLLAIE
jgi:hypothetical protein